MTAANSPPSVKRYPPRPVLHTEALSGSFASASFPEPLSSPTAPPQTDPSSPVPLTILPLGGLFNRCFDIVGGETSTQQRSKNLAHSTQCQPGLSLQHTNPSLCHGQPTDSPYQVATGDVIAISGYVVSQSQPFHFSNEESPPQRPKMQTVSLIV